MDFWPLLFVVAMITTIVLIILWVAEFFTPSNPQLSGPACLQDSDCANNGRCQDGSCKSRIGGSCQTLADCTKGAVACYRNTCLLNPRNPVGGPCPCQTGLICQNGFCRSTPCSHNTDCPNGFTCQDGVCLSGSTGCTGEDTPVDSPVELASERTSCDRYLNLCRSRFECSDDDTCSPSMAYRSYRNGSILPVISQPYFPGENIIDLTIHQDSIYLLLEGGDIIKVVDHLPVRIETDLSIERIFSFTGHLYGLVDESIYIASADWRWDRLDHLANVTGIEITLDRKYIWIQTRKKGYLYDRDWRLIETINLSGYRRIYGLSKDHWSHQSMESVTCLDPSGDIVEPPYEDVIWMRYLWFHGEYVLFLILDRGCLRLE